MCSTKKSKKREQIGHALTPLELWGSRTRRKNWQLKEGKSTNESFQKYEYVSGSI